MAKNKGGVSFPQNKPLTQQRTKESSAEPKQPTKKQQQKKSPKDTGLSFLWKKGQTMLLVFMLWLGGEYFLSFDGEWNLSNTMLFQRAHSYLLV